jgi:protein-tyrosine phosphatase
MCGDDAQETPEIEKIFKVNRTMENTPKRVIPFEGIANFRDLGGYAASVGRATAWRRLYRSGDPTGMTARDKDFLKSEIKLKTVIDLSSSDEVKKPKETRLFEEIGVEYFNMPFRWSVADYYQRENERYVKTSDMGAIYLYRISNTGFAGILKQALEILADPQYYPLLFHCGAGKDRTGVLASMLLSLAGTADEDIIADYVLTELDGEEFRRRLYSHPDITEEEKKLLGFSWWARPEYMQTFLDGLRKEYGGVAGYLKKFGAEKTLVKRLKKALLV